MVQTDNDESEKRKVFPAFLFFRFFSIVKRKGKSKPYRQRRVWGEEVDREIPSLTYSTTSLPNQVNDKETGQV